MPISFGPDPVITELEALLRAMEAGESTRGLETKHLDLKEEAGRRGQDGSIRPGEVENEAAADKLAGEAVCMANTEQGGALILGVADDGALIGTAIDAEWLRHRIYDKTQRLLTVDVREVSIRGTRLLVLISPQAIEPIRWKNKIYWRVDDTCVEVDAATWHARRMFRTRYDWSAQESHVGALAARPGAIEAARDFLRSSGEAKSLDIASADPQQLLTRLNVVTENGFLTNAGVIAFVGRDAPCVDYIRRDVPGGDSRHRVRRDARSLLEELTEVFQAVQSANGIRHLQEGLTVRQLRELPDLAIREAIVNGVAHREWAIAEPTVVEHVGRTLRVTSPGGFVGGVNEHNIITHPSQSRNKALAELLASLRVAEREGIGVDRMVREMIRVGHQTPDIREISGPFVRASLIGDDLDEPWIQWINDIEPTSHRSDLNSLLLLRRLVETGWIDPSSAASLIQLTAPEARGAIHRLADAQLVDVGPLVFPVKGTPAGSEPAWKLARRAQAHLQNLDRIHRRVREWPSKDQLATSYAAHRGRISSTELGSLSDTSPTNLGPTLKGLEEAGVFRPSRASRRGPGFFYVYVGSDG